MTGKTELVPTNISAGVVDNPGRLEKSGGWLKVLPLPEDAPVLQLGQTLGRIESVNRPCEHQQLVLWQFLLDGEVVHVQPDRDVLVVEQHIFKHGGVAVLGQCLVGSSFLDALASVHLNLSMIRSLIHFG